ncbi:EamA family transporter [Novosphingobium sp. BL-8H]|uniref:DMT family transporter n=1 Tax=Novosphingobium sp. BL-8H TaxID=3127640 RepID=UPI003757A2FE
MTSETPALASMQIPASKARSDARYRDWLLLFLLLLCWSSSFIGIRFTIDYAPIALVAFWRNLIAGVLLLPLAFMAGPLPNLRQIVAQAFIGVFAMGGLILGCGFAIEQGVPTGIVALMSDMLPLAIVLFSVPILGKIISRGEGVGVALAACGVIVASTGALRVGEAPLWAYGLPIAGMISIAVVTLLQQRWPWSRLPIYQSLAIQSLSSAVVFLAVSLYGGRLMPPAEPKFWYGMTWLVLFATIGAYGLYYFCLRKLSPSKVSSVLYLSPPATMVWGRLMFGEPLSLAMGIGLGITLAGLVIVERFRVELDPA